LFKQTVALETYSERFTCTVSVYAQSFILGSGEQGRGGGDNLRHQEGAGRHQAARHGHQPQAGGGQGEVSQLVFIHFKGTYIFQPQARGGQGEVSQLIFNHFKGTYTLTTS
jgi:hypothetical protein